jgi:hypothetical protein
MAYLSMHVRTRSQARAICMQISYCGASDLSVGVSIKSRMLLLLLLEVTVLGSYAESVGAEKVFYVEPTGSRTGCPSPCHSLQYYANNSLTIFTNNSKFLFLEGEHHLYSVVNISNVANLSLVGASLGVKILCNGAPQSGFQVQEFFGLVIENLNISSCHYRMFDDGYYGIVGLMNGSQLHLSHVTHVSLDENAFLVTFLVINNVGSLFVFNSSIGIIDVENVPCSSIIPCTGEVLIENTRFLWLYGRFVRIVLRNNTGMGLTLNNSVILFINCTFGNTHQAISAVSSNLTFEGYNVIRDNTGYRGAGITLINSFMELLPGTHTLFENNHATLIGGAIIL